MRKNIGNNVVICAKQVLFCNKAAGWPLVQTFFTTFTFTSSSYLSNVERRVPLAFHYFPTSDQGAPSALHSIVLPYFIGRTDNTATHITCLSMSYISGYPIRIVSACFTVMFKL